MTIYLRTRTRRTDYSFLGAAPAERWWSEYGRQTAFERPTVIVRRVKDQLQGCFSGIESPKRLDRVGTIIRYTVVVENDAQSILALTQACLLEPGAGKLPNLGQVLDDCFKGDEEIEDLLVDDPLVAEEVSQRVQAALSVYVAASARARTDQTDAKWIAPANLPQGRDALVARVQRLVSNECQGLAALLNLIRARDEAQSLATPQGSLALLVNPDSKLELDGIEALTGAGSSNPTELLPRSSTAKSVQRPLNARALMAAAVLGLIALLAWFALARSATTPEVGRAPVPASVQ